MRRTTRVERARRARERDRGSVILLTAVLMVVLVGMCAFAVDVGQLFNVRRQAQSGVDAAALAGGAELNQLSESGADRRARAAAWAKAISYRDAEIVPGTPAQWEAAWASCVDAGHLDVTSSSSAALTDPSWPAGGATECISFSADMRTMRVKLPTQTFDTAFARVLGVEDMSTSAVAEVELTAPDDGGGILPFAVYAADANSILICAAEVTSFPPTNVYPYDACGDGPERGNFGSLDVTVWGNSGLSPACRTNNDAPRLAFNMANGVDHLVAEFDAADGRLDDEVECDGARRIPNHLETVPGFRSSELFPGMIAGGTYQGRAFDGRLERGDNPKRDAVSGHAVDDRALWSYLDPDIEGDDRVPVVCYPSTFVDGWTPAGSGLDFSGLYRYPDYSGPGYVRNSTFVPGPRSRLHMQHCLDEYARIVDSLPEAARDDLPALFTDELATSPRAGWLPVFEGTAPSGNSETKKVIDFNLVYLNTIYSDCSSGSNRWCARVWEPGESPTAERRNRPFDANKIDGMGAYMFRTEMLPPILKANDPATGGSGVGAVQLSR